MSSSPSKVISSPARALRLKQSTPPAPLPGAGDCSAFKRHKCRPSVRLPPTLMIRGCRDGYSGATRPSLRRPPLLYKLLRRPYSQSSSSVSFLLSTPLLPPWLPHAPALFGTGGRRTTRRWQPLLPTSWPAGSRRTTTSQWRTWQSTIRHQPPPPRHPRRCIAP